MILGFSGKALVGKDTAADYMVSHCGWDKKTGFAYNLKEACSSIFNLEMHKFTTQEGKCSKLEHPLMVDCEIIKSVVGWMQRTHDVAVEDVDYGSLLGKVLHTPRDILQFVGTEVMRSYVADYHIDVVVSNLLSDEKIVVADVRFENEAEGILNAGGFLVRIERPLELREMHGVVVDTNHPSETSLDGWENWSYRIQNNGKEVVSLYKEVDRMITKLGIKI